MPLSRPDTRPDVSIVMPVFNKLELTRVCLESLHLRSAQASFEIIVVDNGTTDGTRRYLEGQAAAGNLKAILNDENQGFARGCNTGATAAQGRYVLFLNNDMEVRPGWLDPMVSTLDNDPDVGIAGSRLFFPDGTIQHAGVAIYRQEQGATATLAGMNLNYKLPADTPGALKPLALQAVTGACLIIRRQLFQDLNGFDTGYYNGNEDVDLCLRAGERAVADLAGPTEGELHPTAGIKVRGYAEPRLRRRLDEAWRAFTRVQDLAPGFHRAANNLACILWQLDRCEEAVGILEKVRQEDPDNEDARWNLEQMAPEIYAT